MRAASFSQFGGPEVHAAGNATDWKVRQGQMGGRGVVMRRMR
jgi:hypothetical protein